MVAPAQYSIETASTTTRQSVDGPKTRSSSFILLSNSNLYWKPEHPPPSTITRKNLSFSSLVISVSRRMQAWLKFMLLSTFGRDFVFSFVSSVENRLLAEVVCAVNPLPSLNTEISSLFRFCWRKSNSANGIYLHVTCGIRLQMVRSIWLCSFLTIL